MVTNKQSWIYHWLRVGKRVRGLELWAWRHAQAETSGKVQKKAAQRALVVTDLSCEGACRALCSPIALPALFLCCLGSWRGSHKKWNSSPQLSGIKSNCLRETITKAHILDQLSGGSPGVAVGVYSRPASPPAAQEDFFSGAGAWYPPSRPLLKLPPLSSACSHCAL